MIGAYDEKYLDTAMRNLGEAFDYAVNACGWSLRAFAELFGSGAAGRQFEKGNPKYVAGLSGTELCMEVVTGSGLAPAFPPAQVEYDYSAEYWCGWILAYYQWRSGKRFGDILEVLPMDEIRKLYGTLHEASEEKFADVADAICARRATVTRLQRQRKRCGCTQKALAERTGVNLRTLQQYEAGAKSLRKAAVETVLALANALGCAPEDLLD